MADVCQFCLHRSVEVLQFLELFFSLYSASDCSQSRVGYRCKKLLTRRFHNRIFQNDITLTIYESDFQLLPACSCMPWNSSIDLAVSRINSKLPGQSTAEHSNIRRAVTASVEVRDSNVVT